MVYFVGMVPKYVKYLGMFVARFLCSWKALIEAWPIDSLKVGSALGLLWVWDRAGRVEAKTVCYLLGQSVPT